MARELRRRKSRPNYATLAAGYDDDGAQAGPSAIPSEDDDSGGDFAPDEENIPDGPQEGFHAIAGGRSEHVLGEGNVPVAISNSSPVLARTRDCTPPNITKEKNIHRTKSKSSMSKTQNNMSTMSTQMTTPGPLLKPFGSKMYALPTPSIHHRHRAVPVYFPNTKVERLESLPPLFGPTKIVATNNFTSNTTVTERLSKAWGYNVGAGPLWDLMEDRSSFKEAADVEGETQSERNRRPRVYQHVCVKEGWEILDSEKASPHLPTDTVMTEEGNFQPPPPLHCFLGPVDKQSRVETNMFDSHKMSAFFPESKSHVFNAGAPVWGLDWCPTHPDFRSHRCYKQYLAVAPFPSRSHSPIIGAKIQRPALACIQIWALRPTQVSESESKAKGQSLSENDPGEMKCEMVLCLDSGPAQEIKWCPLPSHDDVNNADQRMKRLRKLGILAGTFEDGSLSIYAVPDPVDVTPQNHNHSQPVFVRLPEPLLRIELEDTSCWTLDWANSEVIAVGCTNGNLAVYNIRQALDTGDGPNIFPTHLLTVHQSAFRALAWIRIPPVSGSGTPMTTEDPTVIASGGYDGVECLTDIREPQGNVMNRTRDVINSVTYSPYAGGPIMIDHDNSVKAYSVSPTMLGRGHVLLEPNGPVWSVSGSDYHPQLAVGSADGACLTTNTLRATRRGGVPFFVHKIFQLDYSRNTGEFRMLEHFLPQESQEKPTNTKLKDNTQARKDEDGVATGSTGVWPPEVGIHRVAWNSANGLGGAPWLASATASGLCRIDWLLGRWIKDKVPYGSVEAIRQDIVGSGEYESD